MQNETKMLLPPTSKMYYVIYELSLTSTNYYKNMQNETKMLKQEYKTSTEKNRI